MPLEFVPPPWLEDQSDETIHARMMEALPPDIDNTEAGFPWDFTKPTALEISQMLENETMETVRAMHYMFAHGIYLDYHAKPAHTSRRSPTKAIGYITVEGKEGTVISKGTVFAVPASGDAAAVFFVSTADARIPSSGSININIEAAEPGVRGNVAANTIIIASTPIAGVTSITNPEPTTGGTAEEDDESLRARIEEFYKFADISYVGCDNDYHRWALEVDGVGAATVMPEWNGPGTVKVVILDQNGDPANEEIVNAVIEHIVSPSDRMKRLAPIGATVTIEAPDVVKINITCKLRFSGEHPDNIVEAIKAGITEYMAEAREAGIVRTTRIGAIIIGTDGVADYDELKLNGSTENIPIQPDQFPALGTFTYDELEEA